MIQLHLSKEVVLSAVLALVCAYLAFRETDDRPAWRTITLSALAALFGAATIGIYFNRSIKAETVSGLKAAIALTAAALSMYEAGRVLQKKAIKPRVVKAFAAALAILAVGGYFRFGDLGYSQFYHRWEFFHYYMGAKYYRELEYERLYKCTAIAQADLGQANEVRARKLRDLAEDVLEPTQPTLEHPEQCKDRFTPERWEAFKADVKWFRASSNLQYWNDMQKDHGFNPPPVWSIAGHVLASLHPASDHYLKLLAAFDPLFFIGLFTAVFWAFGWRVAAVAVIFWGCQLPAEYFWTGGAFLRQDWIFWLVLSACLVRKRWFALGGAAFAYSTLLRVFPGALIAGWFVVAGAYFYKHKRFAPHHLRIAMGGLLATAILVTTSIGMFGKESYPAFWKHIQTHANTPLTNNMGLKTIVSHSLDGRMQHTRDEKLIDPFMNWKNMRRERFQSFKFLYFVMIGGLAAAFVYVVRRIKTLWVAQALSLSLVVALVETTCYYYSMFILAAFLSRLRRGFEQAALFVAGMSQLLVLNRYISYFYDDRYTAQSVLFVGYAVALVFSFWPVAPKAAQARAQKTDEDAVADDLDAKKAIAAGAAAASE